MYKEISFSKELLNDEYTATHWITESGLSPEMLEEGFDALLEQNAHLSVAMQKAKGFEFICRNAQIAVDSNDIFQDKINHCKLIGRKITFRRRYGEIGIWDGPLKELHALRNQRLEDGFWQAGEDFGHVCSDWERLLRLGFYGILDEINRCLGRADITEQQREFYTTCKIYYEAIILYINRLADWVECHNLQSATALRNIAKRPPRNMYEALQAIFIYFSLHEFVCGARNRTFGRLDKLLYGFYKKDIADGIYTDEQIRELFRFFMYKLWLAEVPFDQPFMLGGADADGSEITNELSYIIVDEYDKLDIHSPKIHIGVSDKTPDKFLKRVMECIRKGHSSFLIVNDAVAVKSLINVGIDAEHAENYVLIGCYEPAAFGTEIPCTGNASFNSVKALEYALAQNPSTPDELYSRTMELIKAGIGDVMKVVRAVEGHYMDMYPDPMLSATYQSCMENGADAYSGGAMYNNSSINVMGIATLVDCFAVINKFVSVDRTVTFEQIKNAVAANWDGYEDLRQQIQNSSYRYGNGCEYADKLAMDIAADIAGMINNIPNARGGIFKAGLYSIDHNVRFGALTGATPDGRKSGDAISKNLCPTSGMEYGGITTVIRSVGKLDTWLYPNGSVLDLVFHPSAVSGEDGLTAMVGLIKVYFKSGGFAVHGNVFDAEELKRAQKNPDEYKNLQVRVCGWNAYFVNLTTEEQNEFIKQAELK